MNSVSLKVLNHVKDCGKTKQDTIVDVSIVPGMSDNMREGTEFITISCKMRGNTQYLYTKSDKKDIRVSETSVKTVVILKYSEEIYYEI